MQRVVILPLREAFQWERAKLSRTIVHELAHIALARYLRFATTPAWFDEGYAEWASGGLTCEGKTRVALELATRSRNGDPPPRLFGDRALGRTRLGYDFFATVFDYLDQSPHRSVSSGALLREIRQNGVDIGIAVVLGVDPQGLQSGWQEYLKDQYGMAPTCS